MSQSQNPKDTQALLQSMLQRLKLQPGREGQAFLHTHVPTPVASRWEGDGGKGASNLQKISNTPVNSLEFGINGISSKEFGDSVADKDGGIQQPGHGSKVGRGHISFPSQKDNTHDGTGLNRMLGQTTSPGITPTRTRQPFPTDSPKDTDITSFGRTDRERVSFGSSVITRTVPSNIDSVTSIGQNHNQGFTSRAYMWSLKPTDDKPDMQSQENKMLHPGNGEFGALSQSNGMQFVASSQNTTNSSSRRKQRSSENKTRRWTQKIKERWRDRPASFSKKGKEKEAGHLDQKSEPLTEEEERTPPLPDDSDPSKISPTHTEVSTPDGHSRSSSDFEFGLGSFSLLDEIVMGQEWAKFLNPNQSAPSAIQRPTGEKLRFTPNPCDSGQSSVILNQQGGGDNPWSFRGTNTSPVSNSSIAHIPPYASVPIGIDVSEGNQQQYVHGEADQSEPMEDGFLGDSGPGQKYAPPSFVEPAGVVDISVLKNRGLNRKRHHQSAERIDERFQTNITSDGKDLDREGSISPPSMTSSHVMDETGEYRHDNITLKCDVPTPLSSSFFKPFVPPPRGVLKHSISQESESSMETVIKRRRVEENRRVRFSEEVMSIEAPELGLDMTDSEEDLGSEVDSVIEQECEVVQATLEEVAPVRRHALPAWILALKRKNTGKKHR
ncbi:uncharacterized protein LOC113144049 [Mastacembelus armatus]|uniref:uncharacterized protein LOC113144049 n=1 Tax=Mastacembelus armatus TaxID=205130 RepID=UPI000E4613C7|nr:uncharacterized protein LOC113144049 [Mastacembelus armatus]XP_026185507.1 uncharacterized protein LOC113144049 [Mastacembelus armatus]XP_026185508.1 uncharacterized protein LOC113144049 [Mastacembelus armatus]